MRTGLWFVWAVVFVVALSAPTSTASSSTAWHAEFSDSVLLGQFITGNVTGPPGGAFHVLLASEPFNSSVPIIDAGFHFGANQSVINISLPTTLLTLGAYQLSVNATNASQGTSFVLFTEVLRVLDPLNATQVNEEIYLLTQENLALEGQVAGLSGQISAYRFQADMLFWVFFSLVAFLIFKEWFQSMFRRRRDMMRKVREGWKNIVTEPRIYTFSGMDPSPIVTPGFNEDRKFVSAYCPSCRTLRTLDEMVRHLASHGRVEPVLGKDYWESDDIDKPEPSPSRGKELRQPRFRLEDG